MNNTIYVTGHKNPDTDSICAAITYTELLRQQGEDAVACRQGPLNEETKYVLKYFGLENPLLMTDARTKLKDIDLDTPTLIEQDATVHHAWHVMLRTRNRSLFVVDENGKLCGVCTTSNLSSYRLQENKIIEDLMATATLANIARTIGGTIAVDIEDFHSNGKALVITLDGVDEGRYQLKNSIAIMSSGMDKQIFLIEKGVGCLVLTCGVKAHEVIRKAARERGVAIIETDEDTMHTAAAINESYSISQIMTRDVICFEDEEYVPDVAAKMTRSRVRSYPVIDENGDVVGAISRYHTLNYHRRNIVLVDHSARNQSINHVEDAHIVAIVDHHHIGNIETDYPIDYRNVRCGCTCTIISKLYKEHGVTPSREMAGLMMSAILSDTLNFKSATTTDMDRQAVKELAEIAGIKDVDEYARNMLGASVDLKNATPEDILKRDLKTYEIGKYRFAIGQTNYSNREDVTLIVPSFREYMPKQQEALHLDLLVMCFTDVMGGGSAFLFYGPLSNVMSEVIETNFDEHYGFDSHIISRKQQLMPKLSELIKNM